MTLSEIDFYCGFLLVICAYLQLYIKVIREDIEAFLKTKQLNSTIKVLIGGFTWGFLLMFLGIFLK